MLFDLQSGRRRTVVRVVYSMLAVSFLIGFVIFGVGSSGVGGIGDLISGGSSDNAAESAQQAAIDSAEKKLKKDPKNQAALISLARAYYLAGAGAADTDENGQPVPSDETLSEWNKALDAWERYLKTDPKEPDPALAPQIANAYQAVGDFSGAADTQQLVVDAQPNSFNYYKLAFLLYANGKLDAGKAAADQAIAKAKNSSQKKQLQKALDSVAKQAASIQKASKKQSQAGGNQLQDPFGGLGGGSGTTVVPGG